MNNEAYLERVVVELHDDGFRRANPAFHVHERRPPVGEGWLAVASFRQVFIHVLSKVLEQGEPLQQVRRHHVTHVVARRFATCVLEIEAAAKENISYVNFSFNFIILHSQSS